MEESRLEFFDAESGDLDWYVTEDEPGWIVIAEATKGMTWIKIDKKDIEKLHRALGYYLTYKKLIPKFSSVTMADIRARMEE